MPSLVSRRSSAPGRLRSALLDPRLILGVILVAGSVVGVVALVAATDDAVEVYVARDPVAPGDLLTTRDLVVRTVGPAATADRYLSPGDIPSGGVLAGRAIGEGELVAATAVGDAAGLHESAIVIDTPTRLPASVGPGSTVDLWASRVDDGGTTAAPVVIVSGASVVRLIETESIVGGGTVSGVELLVPKSRIARVVEALARGDVLAVIPTGIPLAR